MRAVILAGGPGTTLRPLTADRPAPLLPVVNRPLIEHLLEHLVRQGVTEAMVALHHCPYPLEAYLGDGTRWGLSLRYALERRRLGTAGAARGVAARFTEPFVLAFATALTAADLGAALAAHESRRAALTLIVHAADAANGPLGLDESGGVALNGARSPARVRFTGVALVEPAALAHLAPGDAADLLDDLVPRLLAAGHVVHAYPSSDAGLVVRTLADLALANRRALAGELPGLVLPGFEVRPGIRLCHGAHVQRGARLIAPVLVGADALVGRGARIEAAVLGDQAIVEPRAWVSESVVLPRTHVGPSIRVHAAVVDRERLGRPATGSWTRVADPRVLGDTRAPLRARRASLGGRLLAAGVLVAGAPIWAPLLFWLAAERRGWPLRARRMIGARGQPVRLRRLAVDGPLGRLLHRLGLVRAPQLWNVVRGDLHWVGTTARPLSAVGASADAPGPDAPPGLVTLAMLAPTALSRRDREAFDRLYRLTRTPRGDVRLLVTAVRRRLLRRSSPPSTPVGPRLVRMRE